ncbi:hypothetical protein PR048_027622 [Dryococelus australis]|uniref:Uncharacterized protein n=1 Tax=Dryococelus australis TaxID=614101 RepID=A0ABQ9GGZ5_9NEOP|nr:hypothetical protein PR048_027622 [Dryococelus australis]
MDQGIIKVLKQTFRKHLVCKIVQRMKPGLVPAHSEDPSAISSSAWITLESSSVSCSFESYASVDDDVQTCANQDIEDLCAEHEESEDECDVAVCKPAWSDTTENVDSLNHFLACTPDVASHIWSSLWNLENYVFLQAQKKLQTEEN